MAEMTENLIRLKAVRGVGNATLWKLLREFGGSDGVLGANAAALCRVRGVSRELAERILDAGGFDPRSEMDKAVVAGVAIIPYDDPDYPKPLIHSYDPPALLYVRGKLTEEDQVAVGIVGTRQASPYGRQSALELSAALARGGFTIVSGLARGIDTFAHIGAMNARGRTVGVLGCGFDHMYPEENRDLALEMTGCGAVISEFSMATKPSKETFPTRNRIIAGMALGLIVIEAPVRSGSLITARLANEIGRTVFAVPGRVGDACSEGCNKLIRDGAVMITSADDIFYELNPQLPLPPLPQRTKNKPKKEEKAKEGGKLFADNLSRTPAEKKQSAPAKPLPEEKAGAAEAPAPAPHPKLSEEQKTLLRLLADGEWRNIDQLIQESGLPAGKAASLMGLMAMMRLVEQGPGQAYRLRPGKR